MEFLDNVIVAPLAKELQVCYTVNDEYDLAIIYIRHKNDVYSYAYSDDLTEAHEFYIALTVILRHYLEMGFDMVIDTMIKKVFEIYNDEDALELIIALNNFEVAMEDEWKHE